MAEVKFFICDKCGAVIGPISDGSTPGDCCGTPVRPLSVNSTGAAPDKHLPSVTVDGDEVTVEVGAILHPMAEEHHIEWIYLETADGGVRHALKPGDTPRAVFSVDSGAPVSAYAYCNLHGLWKTCI